MKRTFQLFVALVIVFFLVACGTGSDTSTGGETNPPGTPSPEEDPSALMIPLSENQDFIVPGNAEAGEYVGTVLAYPKIAPLYGDAVFTKIGTDSVFSMNGTGLIVVAEPGALDVGTISFDVAVSVQGLKSTTIQVSVQVLDADDCVFVDPDSSSDGDGSRDAPRNVMPAFYANQSVLFKRGTRLNVPTTIYIDGLENVLIGSYGTGAKPVLETGDNVLFRIYNGCTNPVVRDLEFTSSEPARSNPDADYENWANAFIYASSTIGKLKVVYCEIHHSHNGLNDNSSGQPAEAQNSEIKWNHIHDVAQEGIYLQSISGTGTASCNKIERVNLLWSFDESQTVSSGDGIQTYNVHTVHARNNYIDRSFTGNKFNIIAQYDHALTDGTEWVEITDNYFIGNAGGAGGSLSGAMIYADFAHGLISGNIFEAENGNQAVASANSTSDCTISYNVFRACGDAITDPYAQVYNNLFYGCARATARSTNDFKNNIIFFTAPGQTAYHHTIGVNADYNLYNLEQDGMFGAGTQLGVTDLGPDKESNSIVGDPMFVDAAGSDYRLNSQSPAIDKGAGVGETTDLYGNAISGVPDMGVAEYFSAGS